VTEVSVIDGVYWLDPEWSLIERKILQECVDFLMRRGYTYRQITSSLKTDSYRRQGIFEPDGTPILGDQIADTPFRLGGSAEQGILESLCGSEVNEPKKIVALNTCFRREPAYLGLKSVREFQKVEQFVCTDKESQFEAFQELLDNALDYLTLLDIENYRVVDTTDTDPGYHEKKYDIEVYTKTYGWLETHSCSMFGTQQADRYDITGDCRYTLSNTGIATPRILVPLMEQEGIEIPNG